MVTGTVLRQNEPYQNYIIKFGPYWHEVYKSLGLYDVYSIAWFICILAFLVISTSICVIRNLADKKYPQATLTARLPSLELLDHVMYKSITLGFAFFTIATILGTLWPAETWSGYWSW